MIDSIGNAVIAKFRVKYEAGMVEHGGGLQIADNDIRIWLQELQNEALDTAAYCEKILQSLN